MATLYTAHAISTGGREGHVESDNKRLSFNLSKPGKSGDGTNPEELFACGYAACFGGAVGFIAGQKKADASKASVKADVSFNQDDKGFFLGVVLSVDLSGVDQSTAEQIVQEAHQMCPYSKATRGNVNVELRVNNTPLAKAA